MSNYQQKYFQAVTPEMLDKYLSDGWYRIQQKVITTDFIDEVDKSQTVFWLRYDLNRLEENKKIKKIKRQAENFTVNINPFEITEEIEILFQEYRSAIDFDTCETVTDFLLEDGVTNVFNTSMIEIRQDNLLIAAGYFDTGKETVCGILHFYHPEYKKFSLGKYLAILAIDNAKLENRKYYYPGYMSPQNKKFDYKLSFCKDATELFDRSTGQWLPYLYVDLHQLQNKLITQTTESPISFQDQSQ